jgi:integrase
MPRKSRTENVRKLCQCAKWKTCTHAWYLDYQRDNVRYRDNLDKLTGRHAEDFVAAKDEARRAIVAKLSGCDPKGILPADDPTLAQLLTEYEREKPRRDRWQVGKILSTELPGPDGGRVRPFGTWRASAITLETLKQFRQCRPAIAGNRDLALLRAVCNWAVLGGFLPRSPFRVGDVPALRLRSEETRTRRLQPGEAERLLREARRLEDLITAALETGCRKGELLSMQWRQVRFSPRAELFLPAQKTKAKRDRRVPVSSVLAAVLGRRQSDPAGKLLPPDAYVFGDEVGRPRASIKTAWRLTCQRAKLIDLRFHDLRREAGSRWMDAGVPLATIQRWLGHANISQTSTYLGASLGADELDMRVYEERIGRLTQIDVSDRPNPPEPVQTGSGSTKKPQQNTTIH